MCFSGKCSAELSYSGECSVKRGEIPPCTMLPFIDSEEVDEVIEE